LRSAVIVHNYTDYPKTYPVKTQLKRMLSRHVSYICSQKYFPILHVDKRQCLTLCHYSWRFSAKQSQYLRRIEGRCTDQLACSSTYYTATECVI